MSEPPPPIARHEATDRAGTIALRTAHELGAALAGSEADPVVLRRGGPHRSVAGLIALVDAALADNEASADEDPGGTADRR